MSIKLNPLSFEITSRCVSCDSCHAICPEGAVLHVKDRYMIDSYACSMCGLCVQVCPAECIKESGVEIKAVAKKATFSYK